MALRKTLLLLTHDLLAVTREFINPAVSRAGLGRCLRRHGVSSLRDLVAEQDGDTPTAKKTFKDYEPGFLHIDIRYLPQMQDRQPDPLRRGRGASINSAQRLENLQLQHSPERVKASNADSGTQEMARNEARTVREKGV